MAQLPSTFENGGSAPKEGRKPGLHLKAERFGQAKLVSRHTSGFRVGFRTGCCQISRRRSESDDLSRGRQAGRAKFCLKVSLSNSPSQRARTSVATPFPIILTKALNILRKRSIPRINAMPATGMVGITDSVATSAMKDAPCTPLA